MTHIRRHSHWISLVALLAALLGGGYTVTRPKPPSTPSKPTPAISLPSQSDTGVIGTGCDASFERFTYHPARLVRLKDCVTASGMVVLIRHEADGDLHVQFQLDPPYLGLMNASNADPSNRITGGYFIIEPDCVGGAVTQADAVQPCTGAVPPPGFALLMVGAHLKVSGPWVNDSQHGHLEIHPIERIELA